MKKAAEEEEEGPILGKVGTHLTMGIVGLPNVGKSTVRAYMLLVVRGPRVEASLTHARSCSISSRRWACRQRTFLSGRQSACVIGCSCSHAHTRICSTIDPSTSRVYVPDERFDFLQESFKPKSALRAFLEITDIAG